jgi:hypothetical protein
MKPIELEPYAAPDAPVTRELTPTPESMRALLAEAVEELEADRVAGDELWQRVNRPVGVTSPYNPGYAAKWLHLEEIKW